MPLKLKDSVIFKDVNENCIYAVDCLSDNDAFYKFEGPAKFFIESLKDGKSENEIILMAIDFYEDSQESQIRLDFIDFVEKIREFDLVN